MSFNWLHLVVAIIVFAALSSATKIGKWLFGLVMLGILLAFGDSAFGNKGLPKTK